MLIILLFVFIGLFFIGYYYSKDILAPYTLISLLWGGILFLYLTLDHNLFPIYNKFPCAIFIWVITFYIFSMFVEYSPRVSYANRKYFIRPNKTIIKLYYFLTFLSIPIIVYTLIREALMNGTGNFLLYLRMLNTGLDENIEAPNFGVLSYFISTSLVLFLIELTDFSSKKLYKIILLFILNLFVAFITMSKTMFLILLLSSVIVLYKKKKISVKVIILSLVFFALFSIILQSYRSMDGEIDKYSFFFTYLLSGSVAFDYMPEINQSWGANSFRFVYAIMNALGVNVTVNNAILNYIFIPEATNVYTVLYPYYTDFGYIGVFIFACLNGSFLGFLNRKSKEGHPAYVVLFSIFSVFLVLNFIGELVFTNFSNTIQYIFYALLPYSINFKCKKYDN